MDDQLKQILNEIGVKVNLRRDEQLKHIDLQREFEIERAVEYYNGACYALECVEKLLQSKNAEIAALKQEFQHLRARLENQNE